MRQFRIGFKKRRTSRRCYLKSKMNDDLVFFWKIFKHFNKKIELLQEYAQKRYEKIFSYNRLRKFKTKYFNNPCFICNKQPTITHHIIQLQNGGLNIKNNFIRLCEDCHSKIHPWLNKDDSEVIAETTRPREVDLTEIGVAGLKSLSSAPESRNLLSAVY